MFPMRDVPELRLNRWIDESGLTSTGISWMTLCPFTETSAAHRPEVTDSCRKITSTVYLVLGVAPATITLSLPKVFMNSKLCRPWVLLVKLRAHIKSLNASASSSRSLGSAGELGPQRITQPTSPPTGHKEQLTSTRNRVTSIFRSRREGPRRGRANPMWRPTLPPVSMRRCDVVTAPVVSPNRYQASNPRFQSSRMCFGSPTSRASRHARVVGGFGTVVLARRLIAVMSSRDCVSCSDLATNGSAAIVLVGKKSITAVRTSSRDQSESSGARRPGAALLADIF